MPNKKNQNLFNRKVTLSYAHVSLFAIVFALIGVFAILQSSAAPSNGRGGRPSKGSSSLTMVMVSPSPDGVPHWGQQIKFEPTTNATTEPHVSLVCRKNGTVVYTSQTGYYDSYPWPWTQTFTLASGAWTSGAADCTATLYSLNNKGGTTSLATLNFQVLE